MFAKKTTPKKAGTRRAAAPEVQVVTVQSLTSATEGKAAPNTTVGQLIVQEQFQQRLVEEVNVLLDKLALHLPGGINNVMDIAKAMVAEAEEDETTRAPKTLLLANDELPRMAKQQDDWPALASAHNANNANLRMSIAVLMALNSVL